MQPVTVKVRTALSDEHIPAYQTPDSAGVDLRAAESGVIPAGGRLLVKTGLFLEIPSGYEGQVRPRSGLALKHGVTVLNAPGTIDADYRGEVGVILLNTGAEPFCFQAGERVAQLVIAPVVQAQFVRADELSGTSRGEGGFGHTGK